MGANVRITNNIGRLTKSIKGGMTEAFEDVVLDVERVSSNSAPHKTGFLEKNNVRQLSKGLNLEAEVVFKAFSDGKKPFNYAEKMHDGQYNLGPGSKRKPGGTLAFGGGTVPVGPGFLENAVVKGGPGYMEHLQKGLNSSL